MRKIGAIFIIPALFMSGCQREQTAEEKIASCERQIYQVREMIVCDTVHSIGRKYAETGDPLYCVGANSEPLGLSFDAYRNGIPLKNAFLSDCNVIDREGAITLTPDQAQDVLKNICTENKKSMFLDCRSYFE
jgi:hypothetical protein